MMMTRRLSSIRSGAPLHRKLFTGICNTDPRSALPNRWGQIWADYTPLKVSECASGVWKQSGPSNGAAALGEGLMEDGVHDITFEITGDCIIGVASSVVQSDQHWLDAPSERLWNGEAWGVDALKHGVTEVVRSVYRCANG